MITILFCVPLRLNTDVGTFFLENQSVIYCKLRFYLIVVLSALSPYYMCLASFDRCLSTSKNVRIRTWSQTKLAKRLSASTIIIIFIMSIHILIFCDIYNNQCQISPGCIYTFIFVDYLIIIIITFLPDVLMLIFSIITLWSIKKSRQRLAPTQSENLPPCHQERKHLELKLIKVTFCLLSFLFFSK